MDEEIKRPLALFRDRWQAGEELAEHLSCSLAKEALILGIPRGGVAVAAEVARRLKAELDVIVARKLGAPMSAELAIGAVTANGGRFLNEGLLRELEIPASYVEAVTAQEMAEARRREGLYRGSRPKSRLEGRIVIVVDDGLATGATMRAAVRSVRRENPAKLVVAVPVGSQEARDALAPEVDELICLNTPTPFYAVGLYYERFDPIDDAEVQQILQQAGRAG